MNAWLVKDLFSSWKSATAESDEKLKCGHLVVDGLTNGTGEERGGGKVGERWREEKWGRQEPSFHNSW